MYGRHEHEEKLTVYILKELSLWIQKICCSLSNDNVENLVQSMPRKCQPIIDNASNLANYNDVA